MNPSQKSIGREFAKHSIKVALAAAVAAGGMFGPAAMPGPSAAMGQTRPGAPAIAAPATKDSRGLDALSEETVMNELAGRGINSLLNRLFDERKVPPADRDAFQALQALRELGAVPQMNNARRIYLLRQSVEGLDKLLPKLNDLNTLNTYAATLISRGIEPDVDTLDYWGDNASTQARVRPAAKLASAMLKKVADTATQRMPAIANQIKAPDDAASKEWLTLEGLANQATYVGAISAYYEVISIDVSGDNKAAWDERKKIADEAIKYLAQFDNPESGVGPLVKMRIAKLNMAKGDYESARKYFRQIIDKQMEVEKKPVEMQPEPTEFQQNDARYFLAVTDVLAGKPADAEKTANELETWQQSALPGTEEVKKTVGAQMTMLRYRIASAKAELAPAGPQRDKLNQQADSILTKLGEDFPQFQTLITELLVTRLPETADLKAQGVPVLQALITRADGERNKPENAPYDKKVLARGLEASRVMAAKKPGEGGANPKMIEDATLLIPLFLQKQGQLVEAAGGYLDYGTNNLYQATPNAAKAVDQAAYIAFTQFEKKPQDPAIRNLYERALKVAANPPFSRKEAWYPYANWLRMMGDPQQAMAYYRKIPKGDKLETNARYYEMVCMKTLLDQAKEPAVRTQRMRDLSIMIDQLIPLLQAAINANAGNPEIAATYTFRLMYAIAEGAELALKQKQPKQAIAMLAGFEDKIKGVVNEQALKNKAMYIRAEALINDGQIDQAIANVQQLAGQPETAEFAIGMVGELLKRLDISFEAARKANDVEMMRKIMINKAKLTGFLVPWASTHKDPKIKASVHEFQLYDANIKREAGQLSPDPAEKKAVTGQALAAYQALKPKLPKNPAVDLGIGLSHYELKNYKDASSTFGMLIRDGKLGGATTTEVDEAAGGMVVKDNPVFWEATLKWIRSNVELGKDPAFPDADKIKQGAERALKDLYITHKEKTGGEKWADEFTALRKELTPNWEPGVAATPATQPGAPAEPPATQPGAPAEPPATQPGAPAEPPATQPAAPVGQ